MTIHHAYLSIGSNLGDPLQNCCKGVRALGEAADIELMARSPFYKTQPVDYLDQEWFINGALYVKTRLTPLQLLDCTQSIQKRLGRKPDTVRFGPRILDLDIIFYDDLVMETSRLTIPHPRAHKRRFVLQPICDIDPTVVHPGLGYNVQELLNQLVTDDQDIMPCSFGC